MTFLYKNIALLIIVITSLVTSCTAMTTQLETFNADVLARCLACFEPITSTLPAVPLHSIFDCKNLHNDPMHKHCAQKLLNDIPAECIEIVDAIKQIKCILFSKLPGCPLCRAPRNHTQKLFVAAALGDTMGAVNCLFEGADVSRADLNGYTALHYAAQRGNITTAEALIVGTGTANRHAIIEAKTPDGSTPLILAATYGIDAIVLMLARSGALLDAKNNSGNPALCCALANKRLDTASTLIKLGANVNTCDNDGDTPLMTAAYYNCISIIQQLVDAKAIISTKNLAGKTALTWATERNHTEIVELLESLITEEAINDVELIEQALLEC